MILMAIGALANVAQADRSRYAPPFTPMWAAPQLGAEPRAGAPGSYVRIYGATFHRYVQVFYGDQRMQIVEVGKRYIIAKIPWHVRHDDFIYVIDSTGRARTAEPFALYRPRYEGYYPRAR